MRYFDFDNLIDKFSCDFTVVSESEGKYDEFGDWKAGESVREVKQGAIIGIREAKIYRSDGVLTDRDKELFLKFSLGDITKISVIYDGDKYSVETNPQNNPQFTGVWQYTLKWVSAFKGGDKT